MDPSYKKDRERIIKKSNGWLIFKQFMAEKLGEGVDIDKLLNKTPSGADPTISYGTIEIVVSEKCVRYHMFRRRNSAEYDTLIRGFAKKTNMFELLCLLSEDEKCRILSNEWRDIWDDYWTDKNYTGYRRLRSQSESRFAEIKELLSRLNGHFPQRVENRPLVFSKGKQCKGESGLQTAIREMEEETMMTMKGATLRFETPISQRYMGSNGKLYESKYYVIQRDATYSCPKKQLNGIRKETISYELEDDFWLEIPIFDVKARQWEWQNKIDPYKEYGIFSRHFDTIMSIHNHL